MKIDEAIRRLESEYRYFYHHANPDIKDAIKLGIEALIRIRDYRNEGITLGFYTLPGETKD